MHTTELWQCIVDRWRREGICIRPGIGAVRIAQFEAKFGVALPSVVREYFDFVDGTGDEMEHGLYRFWPLAEVKPVHEELAPTKHFRYPDRFSYPDCFVFADHSINCWDYALRLTDDPNQSAPVYRVTASEPPGEMMAESFLEFMTNYSDDPDNIF